MNPSHQSGAFEIVESLLRLRHVDKHVASVGLFLQYVLVMSSSKHAGENGHHAGSQYILLFCSSLGVGSQHLDLLPGNHD